MNPVTLLDLFADSLRFLREALADIPDARAAEQRAGAVNHPAWTMMHVCVANDFLLHLLGHERLCPADWAALAAPGSTPRPDRAAYPPLAAMLDVLTRQHERIDAAVRAAGPEVFAADPPESIRAFAPTIGHMAAYMLVAHENYHLAQIAVWKRVVGLAS